MERPKKNHVVNSFYILEDERFLILYKRFKNFGDIKNYQD